MLNPLLHASKATLPIIYENTRERANLWIYFLAGKESEVDLNSKADKKSLFFFSPHL